MRRSFKRRAGARGFRAASPPAGGIESLARPIRDRSACPFFSAVRLEKPFSCPQPARRRPTRFRTTTRAREAAGPLSQKDLIGARNGPGRDPKLAPSQPVESVAWRRCAERAQDADSLAHHHRGRAKPGGPCFRNRLHSHARKISRLVRNQQMVGTKGRPASGATRFRRTTRAREAT